MQSRNRAGARADTVRSAEQPLANRQAGVAGRDVGRVANVTTSAAAARCRAWADHAWSGPCHVLADSRSANPYVGVAHGCSSQPV